MRDQPALRDVPIAIGGAVSQRGVIATCNYPARAFGVRSAMPTSRALLLCPSLVLVPGRMDEYRAVSAQLMAILQEYALNFQAVSIDEAYLQVAEEVSASQVAHTIRERVRQELGITVSAGVANSKFLAKVASDWNKPDGMWVIRPNEVAAFVQALPVAKIPGIGKVMNEKLAQVGIVTCADAQAWSLTDLVRQFGKTGAVLYERCRGIDHRPLREPESRQTVSVERTFAHDLPDHGSCLQELPALWQRWQARVDRAGWLQRSLQPFVKVKFADFTQTTLADADTSATLAGFERLLSLALQRQPKSVRLLGIGARCVDVSAQQLSLFSNDAVEHAHGPNQQGGAGNECTQQGTYQHVAGVVHAEYHA